MQVKRGDVVWVAFGREGSTMTKLRPAVVIQNDLINRTAPHTIVAAVRHDTRKGLPIHVPLAAGVAGLTKDSVVDLGHIATLPLERLKPGKGGIGQAKLAEVDQALRLSVGLT